MSNTKQPSAKALAAAAKAAAVERPPTVPGTEDQGALRDEVEDASGETVTLILHTVTVTNDPATKVPTQVYDHEVPVLEAIHGEGNVEIVSSEEIDVPNFTVEDEFERLLRKYGQKNEDTVKTVYRSSNRLADELGFARTARIGTSRKLQQAQSISVDHRKKRTVTTGTTRKATKTSKKR